MPQQGNRNNYATGAYPVAPAPYYQNMQMAAQNMQMYPQYGMASIVIYILTVLKEWV
jgi:hypothetical protein